MKKYFYSIIPVLLLAITLVQCTKKGTAIIEPKFGQYSFSTFTVDTFRFRIILNGDTLTESLLSPLGNFSKYISFFDTACRLKIIDAKNNNQLILDTLINLRTGNNNFSIVQFTNGQQPFIPGPPANETPPAAGYFKMRFQYLPPATGSPVPSFNNVKCIIRDINISPNFIVDTATIIKNGFSRFYEVPSSRRLRIRLINPSSIPVNAQIFNQTTGTTQLTPINLSGFNTIVFRGVGVQAGAHGPYLYEVIKVY